LERFKQKGDYLWNFRSPCCGDSKKSKSKARGYFYRKKDQIFYRCHNCGSGLSLGTFIKTLDPYLYQQYKLETFSEAPQKPVQRFFEPPPVMTARKPIELPAI